jgi:CheY-like chemotaxis protein
MEKKKILVVDDEPDVTDLVAYHLKAKGFHVETVNDATASISKARGYQPDLLILDIMMPDLSGIQICRILRADPKLSKVPIIFLTAKAEPHDRIEGLNRGPTTTWASLSAQRNSSCAWNRSCAAWPRPRSRFRPDSASATSSSTAKPTV